MAEAITSKFLYLNNQGLTLPEDQRKYKRMTRTVYYRQGFRLVSFGFLISLYNLANLPAPSNPTHKLLFYGGTIGAFAIISFIQESKKLNSALLVLDQKYEKDFSEVVSK